MSSRLGDKTDIVFGVRFLKGILSCFELSLSSLEVIRQMCLQLVSLRLERYVTEIGPTPKGSEND
jgi:hypothetical protein